MPKVTEDVVKRVAFLSRISLKDDEVSTFASQFNSILDYFSIIASQDLPSPSPTDRLVDIRNVFRDDVVHVHDDDLSVIFPNKEGRYIKAPKIV
ncbi:MAG: Asp-tRNA(Asn)/Glu-tRNA(Gln) amidotransferase subunit GatC [Thermoprotei archaeon]|nr:Asp-tRNA(Asn)/Glu-tRNA(Gln) amidotransferase subunit GatC [TACK group archaeon]